MLWWCSRELFLFIVPINIETPRKFQVTVYHTICLQRLAQRSLPPSHVSGAASGSCLAGSALVCPIKKDSNDGVCRKTTNESWHVKLRIWYSYLHPSDSKWFGAIWNVWISPVTFTPCTIALWRVNSGHLWSIERMISYQLAVYIIFPNHRYHQIYANTPI